MWVNPTLCGYLCLIKDAYFCESKGGILSWCNATHVLSITEHTKMCGNRNCVSPSTRMFSATDWTHITGSLSTSLPIKMKMLNLTFKYHKILWKCILLVTGGLWSELWYFTQPVATFIVLKSTRQIRSIQIAGWTWKIGNYWKALFDLCFLCFEFYKYNVIFDAFNCKFAWYLLYAVIF